jgi:hypothetical protein
MGVGVLIGHSTSSGSTKSAATPVVIEGNTGSSVAANGAESANTSGAAPTKSARTKSTTPLHHVNNNYAPPPGAVRAAIPPGTGEAIEHPAPPSVIKRAKEVGSANGKSYEQASKELPNVVETGP